MHAKYKASISYCSKVQANVKVHNRQTNRQDKNNMPPIIRYGGIKKFFCRWPNSVPVSLGPARPGYWYCHCSCPSSFSLPVAYHRHHHLSVSHRCYHLPSLPFPQGPSALPDRQLAVPFESPVPWSLCSLPWCPPLSMMYWHPIGWSKADVNFSQVPSYYRKTHI